MCHSHVYVKVDVDVDISMPSAGTPARKVRTARGSLLATSSLGVLQNDLDLQHDLACARGVV